VNVGPPVGGFPSSTRRAPARPAAAALPPAADDDARGAASAPHPSTDDALHTAPHTAPDDALAAEARAKDVRTFRLGARRRVRCALFLGAALGAARLTGQTDAPPALMAALVAATLGVSLAAQLLARALARREGAWRPWLQPAFAAVDAALISGAVLVFGAPSLALLYLVAIVPYAFDRGRLIGWGATLASVVGFLAASWGHARIAPADAPAPAEVLGAAALLLGVALQIVPIPARLIRRVRDTRAAMAQAEAGDLSARAAARHHDELGYLERGYNRLLARFAALLDAARAEGARVVDAAAALDQAGAGLARDGATVRRETEAMAAALDGQRHGVAEAARRAAQAADAAARVQARAADAAGEARALGEAAGAGRQAVADAARSLVDVSARVRESAAGVDGLVEASARAGALVATLSRLARQSHRVALNASIEAARAGDAGREFAQVADAMRRLAEESSRAARAAGTSIGRVRDEVDAVARALAAGATAAAGVHDVAAGAVAAFERVEDGVARIDAVTTDASSLARTQGGALRELAGAVEGAGRVADDAATRARAAAQAMRRQVAAVDEVAGTARALGALAERLRAAVAGRR
jgi:methyl-accepting chemotaxis protein